MTDKHVIMSKDFDEQDEPSVFSNDPNERKLARKLRIQKRCKASQTLDDEETQVIDDSITEKQIIASAELLEKIILEGNEVITNVRVANDARELERRKQAKEIRDNFLKQLEKSTEDCTERYDLINSKWAKIFESNDPLDIKNEMEMQKKKCDDVLAIKDSIIAELKHELQKADVKYFEDQKMQKDDIKLLTERIENQMCTMENVYDHEIELIEKSLKIEKDDEIKRYQEKWDLLYKQQGNEDEACNNKRYQIMKDYEEEMEKVMTTHDEEFRAQKIKLENECQALQQELERTKALCLLNAEKLAYNYTVLKNREEENSIVKSQQKRKINKLQGIINNLKTNYAELEESTKLEIDRLSSHILKAHRSILELEEKSIHFTRINEKQYLDVWNMNTENANELVNKILEADKTIHENTLGVVWEPPDKFVLKKEDLPSYCEAMNIIKNRKEEKSRRVQIFKNTKVEKSALEKLLERKVLHNILQQISKCSGYLIEDKLQDLISSRSEEEKTIIRLDNVFQALSISSAEEINVFLDFFLPYAHCPTCLNKESTNDEPESQTSSELSRCTDICNGCTNENIKKLVKSVKNEVEADNEFTENTSETNTLSFNTKSEDSERDSNDFNKFTCNAGHILEIQAAHVTKVLKEIVTKFSTAELNEVLSFEDRLKEKKYTVSRNLSTDDVKNYWASYSNLFNSNKEKLWDAILMGLGKYFEILKERHKLCNTTENLRKQNAEFERLLKSATNSGDGSSQLQIKSVKRSAYE